MPSAQRDFTLHFQAEQQVRLPWSGSTKSALDFLRDPRLSLSHARFLDNLQTSDTQEGRILSAQLRVALPGMGVIALPLRSRAEATACGARLVPVPLAERKAQAQVGGEASLKAGELHFAFAFAAHIALEQEGWGGAAFAKMAQAAATRTLARVTAELPKAIQEAALAYAANNPEPKQNPPDPKENPWTFNT